MTNEAGKLLDAVFEAYRHSCETQHIPCPPHVSMLNDEQRRALMLLAGVMDTQISTMVDKEKNR